MFFTYIIKSNVNNKHYYGHTNNLQKRLNEHNSGLSGFTKPYIPLELEAFVGVKTKEKARELEKYFKTGSGKAVLKKRTCLQCTTSLSFVILTLLKFEHSAINV